MRLGFFEIVGEGDFFTVLILEGEDFYDVVDLHAAPLFISGSNFIASISSGLINLSVLWPYDDNAER